MYLYKIQFINSYSFLPIVIDQREHYNRWFKFLEYQLMNKRFP